MTWQEQLYKQRLSLGESHATPALEKFITNLLTTERKAWVEEVRKEIENSKHPNEPKPWTDERYENDTFNKVLQLPSLNPKE